MNVPRRRYPVLDDAWQRSRHGQFSPILGLQTACSLALALYQTERYGDAQRVCDQSAAAVRDRRAGLGDAAALGIARLVDDPRTPSPCAPATSAEAQRLLRRAVVLSHVWGLSSQIVLALTGLAEAELAAGEVGRARAAVAEARELVAAEPIWRFAVRGLDEIDVRVGRGAIRAARRPQVLLD